MVLEADPLTCLAEEAPPVAPIKTSPDGVEDAEEPHSAPGAIKEPRKVKHVNPVYPRAAKERHIEGAVVLEAILSPTGCVRSLEVLRGIRTSTGSRYAPFHSGDTRRHS